MARQNARVHEGTHFPAFDMGAAETHSAPPSPNGTLEPFKALVKQLSEAYGPSGSEEQVRELVRDEIKGLVDQVRTDALGNLVALRRGSGSNRKKIALAAHLDEIGLMVTFVDSRGFMRFGALGGLNPSNLLGARVQFADGTLGVIAVEDKNGHAELVLDKMFIDAGSAGSRVRVGDAACIARAFVDGRDYFVGKALSGRLGCALIIEAMRHLKKSPHDIYCIFTVQHEVGARGAGTAAFSIQPDLAFVLDAAPAHDVPGGDASAIGLGKGPAIRFKDETMLTSPSARQALIQAAREARVPYQLEVTPGTRGDGTLIQAAREGVPTGALALPMRYIHTPSEMVAYADTQNALQLLSVLLSKGEILASR